MVAGNAHVCSVDENGHGIATADAHATKWRIHDGGMEWHGHWAAVLPDCMAIYAFACWLARWRGLHSHDAGKADAPARAGVVDPSVCMFPFGEEPIDGRAEASSRYWCGWEVPL